MKTSAIRNLRKKLAENIPVFGLWVTLESPTVTEMAVALGLDWVVIDAEHGHLDWKEIVEHLRATVRSETVALVRIAELNGGDIKRALDIGADGIVVPWVETAEQLKQAVAFSRYPTEGVRGIGAERATCWGQCFEEHTAEANEHVLVVPIIETVQGARQVPMMCQVDGVELFWFGPADFSSSAGYRGQWEGPGIAEQILKLKDTIHAAGKHCGVLATSIDNIHQRQAQGFRAIGVGTDTGLLLRSLRTSLASVGRDRTIRTSLVPDWTVPSLKLPPLSQPPETMRPDRPEVMTALGSVPKTDIARGVSFECLVGRHNQAKHLTTGIVTFAPGAMLPYHAHTFTESITLLNGALTVDVEGRSYQLTKLDNAVIPASLAHSARNSSLSEPAVVHIAMATDIPSRTLIERFFSKKAMPDDSTGVSGSERINRFATAKRGVAGPNTEFIDCFNEDLMPKLEMSGGYGLFEPGGRLPAHVHDFDESICIISGTATCVVEGRKYLMSDCSTALQPRGRVHYFINESNAPMEMIWVYAGPKPERIIVDERCATTEGNPWR
ncbi:MAG: aldolase/citrate lyase family protein [Planctomycetales bacterium]|jgi:2-dehydro-3-deoxyglucarate aldolase/4-hydroxy-2-oxoheptanedioate aldolase|nr:aldolase/citrate lyase family protein [Planctomycetales bacterium]